MKQIDLVQFAEHSQKLPGKFLTPVQKKEQVSTARLLTAHMFDFGAVFVMTSVMGGMFNQSVKMILVSKSLNAAFSELTVMSLAFSFLPMIVFSYFFFSYFMNHGQTFGMMVMKKRIEMESKSFSESLRWAAFSLMLCFSGGLSYFITKPFWRSFKGHDYLYSELMTEKQFAPINLLSEIDKFEEEKFEEENYARAA